MSRFVLNLNKQDSPDGANYEVHNMDNNCPTPPKINFDELGNFYTCGAAVDEAKAQHPSKSSSIDGCKHCCPACHNG